MSETEEFSHNFTVGGSSGSGSRPSPYQRAIQESLRGRGDNQRGRGNQDPVDSIFKGRSDGGSVHSGTHAPAGGREDGSQGSHNPKNTTFRRMQSHGSEPRSSGSENRPYDDTMMRSDSSNKESERIPELDRYYRTVGVQGPEGGAGADNVGLSEWQQEQFGGNQQQFKRGNSNTATSERMSAATGAATTGAVTGTRGPTHGSNSAANTNRSEMMGPPSPVGSSRGMMGGGLPVSNLINPVPNAVRGLSPGTPQVFSMSDSYDDGHVPASLAASYDDGYPRASFNRSGSLDRRHHEVDNGMLMTDSHDDVIYGNLVGGNTVYEDHNRNFVGGLGHQGYSGGMDPQARQHGFHSGWNPQNDQYGGSDVDDTEFQAARQASRGYEDRPNPNRISDTDMNNVNGGSCFFNNGGSGSFQMNMNNGMNSGGPGSGPFHMGMGPQHFEDNDFNTPPPPQWTAHSSGGSNSPPGSDSPNVGYERSSASGFNPSGSSGGYHPPGSSGGYHPPEHGPHYGRGGMNMSGSQGSGSSPGQGVFGGMNQNWGQNFACFFPTGSSGWSPGGGPPGAEQEYTPVANVDEFVLHIYKYYASKGLNGRIADYMGHLMALGFTIIFSFVLVFYVDWKAIFSCKSEVTCENVHFFYDKPLENLGFFQFVVLMYFIGAGIYLVFNMFRCLEDIRHAMDVSNFYKNQLGIPSDDVLSTMSWAEVVDRIIIEQKRSPFIVKQVEITALQITNIIMREENLMIGLVNNDIIKHWLPDWLPLRVVFCKTCMWVLGNILKAQFFDHRSKINPGSIKADALCHKLRFAGFLALVGLGPICLFVFLYFFMANLEDFRSHRTTALERQWTHYAEWFFREYNELPHSFKQRMEVSKTGANFIVDRNEIVANTPILDASKRTVKYVCGSFLAVLVVIACYDDSPLLFLKVGDKNLLWYLAVLGFLVTISDTSTKKKKYVGSVYEGHSSATLYMEKVILEFAKSTHYIPLAWRAHLLRSGGALLSTEEKINSLLSIQDKYATVEAFGKSRDELQTHFFVPRIQQLLEEMVGLIVTPLLFLVYFPRATLDICNFIEGTRYEHENLGDWCSLACFELEKTDPRLSRNGKIEKSALSFALTYRQTPSLDADSHANPVVTEATELKDFGAGDNGTTMSFDQATNSLGRAAHTVWGYPMHVLRLCWQVEQCARAHRKTFAYLGTNLTEIRSPFVVQLNDGSFRMTIELNMKTDLLHGNNNNNNYPKRVRNPGEISPDGIGEIVDPYGGYSPGGTFVASGPYVNQDDQTYGGHDAGYHGDGRTYNDNYKESRTQSNEDASHEILHNYWSKPILFDSAHFFWLEIFLLLREVEKQKGNQTGFGGGIRYNEGGNYAGGGHASNSAYSQNVTGGNKYEYRFHASAPYVDSMNGMGVPLLNYGGPGINANDNNGSYVHHGYEPLNDDIPRQRGQNPRMRETVRAMCAQQ